MDVSSATSTAAMEVALNKAQVGQEVLNKTMIKQEEEENKYAAKMNKPVQSVTGDGAKSDDNRIDVRV